MSKIKRPARRRSEMQRGHRPAESSATRAREVLVDQTRFELSDAQHKRFMHILDEPLPKESQAALKRLLTRKPSWEK